MPTGTPLWRLMHPARQRETMQALLCQVCVQPARTPSGWIFLAGPDDYEPDDTTVITAQPPVCARHVRAAARLCPHLDGRPMVFLVQSAPLHGVHGTLYGYGQGGVHVVAQPDFPLPYGHHNLPTFLAPNWSGGCARSGWSTWTNYCITCSRPHRPRPMAQTSWPDHRTAPLPPRGTVCNALRTAFPLAAGLDPLARQTREGLREDHSLEDT
jgi:hypothetical protein